MNVLDFQLKILAKLVMLLVPFLEGSLNNMSTTGTSLVAVWCDILWNHVHMEVCNPQYYKGFCMGHQGNELPGQESCSCVTCSSCSD